MLYLSPMIAAKMQNKILNDGLDNCCHFMAGIAADERLVTESTYFICFVTKYTAT